jgi:hypothetical protein
LQRDFTATGPNEKWVADLTYIRTWNGFVYLAFILDCYSRMIVGWQLATHMRAEVVLDELEIAPSVGSKGDGGSLVRAQYRPSEKPCMRLLHKASAGVLWLGGGALGRPCLGGELGSRDARGPGVRRLRGSGLRARV